MKFFRFHIKKIYLIAIIVIVSPFLVWGAITLFSEKPPVQKLESCRKLIAEARNKEADKYSPKELQKAEKLWNKAMNEWKLQNEKTMAFRDFTKVNSFSDQAISSAEEAIETAVNRRKSLENELKEVLANMKQTTTQIEQLCQKLPLNHGIRKNLTPVMLKLAEAEEAFQRKDLLLAKKRVDAIKTTILNLKNLTTETLHAYFEDFGTWKRLNDEMISWSKINNSVSLVVDKFSRKCFVYKSGKKVQEFEVELGINWLGGKQFRGDMATPEGKYKIIKKKNSKDTKYYKALLIDFPNDEDKLRFKRAKERGIIPQNSHIGSLIEIHGGGGRGIDWTEGCVALENTDMDKLYSVCSVGTPLVIVGSLKSIDELFML